MRSCYTRTGTANSPESQQAADAVHLDGPPVEVGFEVLQLEGKDERARGGQRLRRADRFRGTFHGTIALFSTSLTQDASR